MPPVFRFAPSPNGYLHLGHALSALLDFETARAAGGRFLLRIEDIDATRCRPEYETAIYQDLAWLGIAWEEPVRRQSEHLDDYRAAVAKLSDMDLIYPSFESRSEIALLAAELGPQDGWPRDPDGAPIYPGTSKHIPPAERARRMAHEPYALRLDMDAAVAQAPALQWEETGSGA
ncbi:MAG TPA: glutamate--tRNA ligase family protein, partial [Xanthobacteraceae bacterium]|nr:glutamate--tRNA ligase family protein [Xanthobacteraceae bacterium]